MGAGLNPFLWLICPSAAIIRGFIFIGLGLGASMPGSSISIILSDTTLNLSCDDHLLANFLGLKTSIDLRWWLNLNPLSIIINLRGCGLNSAVLVIVKFSRFLMIELSRFLDFTSWFSNRSTSFFSHSYVKSCLRWANIAYLLFFFRDLVDLYVQI